MIRILMVDDHTIVRQAVAAMLDALEDMTIVGQASDGREALELCRSCRPDVVVMDVSMPDMNGIEATGRIKAGYPEVEVVGLSMHADPSFVAGMIKAGASGYLLKNSAFEELQSAVREAAGGRCYLSPSVTGRILECFVRGDDGAPGLDCPRLTPREREVLQLLSEGKSSKEIAEHLSLSVRTVEHHRQQIMRRLELGSVAELTKFAVRFGITSLDF